MKATATVLASFIVTSVGMAAIFDMLELSAILASIAMSIMVIVAGLHIYLRREWPLKLAITPLFIGCTAYLVFAYRGDSIPATDYAIELLDSIGIIFLIFYCIWNKRKNHASIRQTQKAPRSEAKDYPAQKMRVVR